MTIDQIIQLAIAKGEDNNPPERVKRFVIAAQARRKKLASASK